MTNNKNESCFLEVKEGEKFLAIYQHKDWWVRPAFPDCIRQVPDRTQLLLIRKKEGYQVILAVSTKTARTDLRGEEGGVRITVSSDLAGQTPVYITEIGTDPYQLCRLAVKKGLAVTGQPQMLRENRKYPEIFDYLGWCSWDAFYHQVSQQGILDKLTEMREKKLPVRWILIDDGWLDADYEEKVLKGPDADREKFPGGLGSCVLKMKEEYGITWAGVWHSVMGYWNGIEKDSDALRMFGKFLRNLPDGRIAVKPDRLDAFGFFDSWHEYLKNDCHIDFVKVDGQSSVSRFFAETDREWSASAEIQKGLNASAALHFHNNIINCMGMGAEDVWNRPNSALSRSSDDFVPETENGFREHALQNSYNCLWQGQLFWGDWDMFFSEHKENRCNSMLRAVSGGPVYTSDRVGKTNPEFILPLIQKDGKIIRCEDTGVPTLDCLFEDPMKTGRILKVFNRYRDCFVIAAFGIGEGKEAVGGRLSATDIRSLSRGEWLVYAWESKKLTKLSGQRAVDFVLEPGASELFLLLPAKEVCVIGILEKYIGCGCVEKEVHEAERSLIWLKEGGTLGFAGSRTPKRVLCGKKEIPFETVRTEENLLFCRAVCREEEKGGCLVEIDWGRQEETEDESVGD